jgi:hypothetical protein
MVREHGGVLEHPACSMLWDEMNLPKPGRSDEWGLSIAVYQQWFGHKAQKATWLYICGAEALPEIPLTLGEAIVRGPWGHEKVKHPGMQRLSKRERQQTPLLFAQWLVAVAKRVTGMPHVV